MGGSKGNSEEILMDELWKMTQMIPKRKISTGCPLFMKEAPDTNDRAPIIPKRLWQALVWHSTIPQDLTWGNASKAVIKSLSIALSSFSLPVTGKGTFKEEFVTCGGVTLDSIHLKTMGSKTHKGLYFAGEILNIDAITGGYNFQAAWSTGFIAGQLG